MVVLDVVTSRLPAVDLPRLARRAGRLLLTMLAAVLYGLGWVPSRAVVLTVAGAMWAWSLVALGWREARQPRAG